jgi:hypothetical protein
MNLNLIRTTTIGFKLAIAVILLVVQTISVDMTYASDAPPATMGQASEESRILDQQYSNQKKKTKIEKERKKTKKAKKQADNTYRNDAAVAPPGAPPAAR